MLEFKSFPVYVSYSVQRCSSFWIDNTSPIPITIFLSVLMITLTTLVWQLASHSNSTQIRPNIKFLLKHAEKKSFGRNQTASCRFRKYDFIKFWRTSLSRNHVTLCQWAAECALIFDWWGSTWLEKNLWIAILVIICQSCFFAISFFIGTQLQSDSVI